MENTGSVAGSGVSVPTGILVLKIFWRVFGSVSDPDPELSFCHLDLDSAWKYEAFLEQYLYLPPK